MAASSMHQQSPVANAVSELFPPETSVRSSDGVLLVDVGGGRGKIINEVRKSRPDLKGRMIVQDLPKEIEGREEAEGIESMTYDFFTPQPIKDSACRSILQQIFSAMKKGYSRLVIMDAVLPNVGASVFGALMDINMIALSGIERTERHWRELLESEGLEVKRILPSKPGRSDSVIEAVLR
ncbi:Demethylsterigmatocystin 6-O-methyltransferase [Lachnellula suecica]|uniref:Demethylsterigmatocystin 6-O-methyltransferase n=1 Tax=Lachnellula suecica TaxID=602035 RepID=A0A8T9CAL1_9HELO|nr:Demethylsterigmatocystin 6-O-methyltransferase [Lachnellula suecica]